MTAGVMLRTPNGKHFMAMDIDGERAGWTTFAGPGNFSIEAGEKRTSNTAKTFHCNYRGE